MLDNNIRPAKIMFLCSKKELDELLDSSVENGPPISARHVGQNKDGKIFEVAIENQVNIENLKRQISGANQPSPMEKELQEKMKEMMLHGQKEEG